MVLLLVNSPMFLRWLSQKDKRAFSLLYDAYAPALYGWILNILPDNKALADQVLKNVFVTAWKTINRHDRRNQKLFVWLLNLTRCLTLAAMYRLDNWPRTTKLEEISDGLRRMLPLIEDGPRQVFELMYYKEYSKAEVAQALNISVETADKLYKAALMQLQIYLTSNL